MLSHECMKIHAHICFESYLVKLFFLLKVGPYNPDAVGQVPLGVVLPVLGAPQV